MRITIPVLTSGHAALCKKLSLGLFCAAASGAAVWQLCLLLSPSDRPVRNVPVVDVDTGGRFRLDIDTNLDGWPAPCPGSGRRSCYPAEVCRWDRCAQMGGTWVVLNETLGRPGPTYCPACGHLVMPQNPLPPQYAREAAERLTDEGGPP